MSKNGTEIRAFTRQIAEEGRVEYSIGQWYHAEKELQKLGRHYPNNERLQPEGYDRTQNTFSVVNPKTGEFEMTLQEYLNAQAERTVQWSSHYDRETGKYTYWDKHNGWSKALTHVLSLRQSIAIVVACREAYPFVNWLTLSSKPHTRGQRRYAAAKEKWDNQQWSGVAYYKRTQQIAVGGLNSKVYDSWLNDEHWALLQGAADSTNLDVLQERVKKQTEQLNRYEEKIAKVEANFNDEKWLAEFIAKEKKNRISYDISSRDDYAQRIEANNANIEQILENGLVEENDVIIGIMGGLVELRPLINPKPEEEIVA
tara:strand:- start:235 stop:1176 length:942 start_codon:yes stop_codon:yes gene_type:complete